MVADPCLPGSVLSLSSAVLQFRGMDSGEMKMSICALINSVIVKTVERENCLESDRRRRFYDLLIAGEFDAVSSLFSVNVFENLAL